MELKLQYAPHPGQRLFHESEARFRVLSCGRRWGKTKAAVAEGIKAAISGSDSAKFRGWHVAPTWDTGRETWDETFQVLGGNMWHLVERVHKTEHTIFFRTGARLQWRSGDKPDSLRGAGLNWLCVDEAAMVKEEAWDTLQPCVADKLGRVILISTPKGHNWFEKEWLRGQEHENPDYESWQFPTSSNPYFHKAEWERICRETPEIVLKQEYMAEFIADAGLVFRNINACIGGDLHPWQPNHQYVMGVDLAKHQDFTVICIMDVSVHPPSVVYFDRFRELDWVVQSETIAKTAWDFNNLPLWLDVTGIGDAIYESLVAFGLNVQPYAFTAASKRNLINRLIIGTEQADIRFPAIPALIAELKAYEYEELPSGNIRYQGPSRGHDDCVTGLALAYWGATGGEYYRMVTMEDLDPGFRPVRIAAY